MKKAAGVARHIFKNAHFFYRRPLMCHWNWTLFFINMGLILLIYMMN